jgi:probable rRNA maturation factor
MMKNSLTVDFSATDKFPEINYGLKMTVRNAIRTALEHEEFDMDAQVSVTFCDNAYIRELNKEYRGKDKHTDVLSFPMYDFYGGEEPEVMDGEPIMLGDVVISLERCREQAEEIGNGFLHEIAFLTAHSLLHLLGYDHERGEEDEAEQCLAQKEIIDEMLKNHLIED